MRASYRHAFAFLCLLALSTAFGFNGTVIAYAQNQRGEVRVGQHATTPPLRDMIPLQERGEGHHEKPLRLIVRTSKNQQPDPVIQSAAEPAALASVGPIISFDGLGVGGGYTPNAAPPDTNGAVGATQYVQWVNESFAVYDKVSGTRVYGPAAGNTLFQTLPVGHPCRVHNDGDPIAQYDKLANRWILTQFSVTSGGSQGYWQCVAVSKTSDATAAYNVYAFNYGNTAFNDYPKLGVWNNGYYITYNIFNNGNTFAGSKVCAFDRTAMLNGTAANQVCFQTTNAFGGLLPADLDGSTPPPAGSPAYFLAFDTNVLQLWKMSNVNFVAGTANFNTNTPITIPVAAFAPACNGGTCIPQSGTTQKLDSLADRLMYRLAYRNFGDHESLVVNHAVTAVSSVGIRWYELRNLSAPTPTVYQQGTYAPDNDYRWMGSAAMDSAGNLAIGYSVSGSIKPAIRFTGRSPGDPLGTLGTPEIVIKDGAGSQTSGLTRWGDYSSLSVDPVDDCTMWYTTEYLQANGSFNWSTRIGYFKFAGCGGQVTPDFAISATPASQSVVQGNSGNYTVNVSASGGFNGTVNLSASGLPSGATASFNPASLNTSGASTMAVTVGAGTTTGSYPLTITGTSGSIVHTTSVTLVVTAAPTPDFTVTASPASRTVVQGNPTTYTATITPSGGFTGNVNLSVSGLPAGANGSFGTNPVVTSGPSTLSITTSASTPTGTYQLTITGTAGALTHTTMVTLVVNSANADFTITASPLSKTIGHPGSATYTVNILATNGFSGTVVLSISGLPGRGVTASFSPSSVTGSGTSTLTINTKKQSSTGQFPLTITGTSGALSHGTAVNLVVQ